MAARKTPDQWSRIQLEYLAGEDSIREIADRHEISEAAIRKRAKADGWERAVRKRQLVRTSDVQPRPAPAVPAEPVEASEIAERGRQLVARMLDELDTVTSRQGELEDMIAEATQDDENDQRGDAMMRAVTLPGRAMTLKNLATALKTINEASAPLGKKAAAQDRAREVAGSSRFRPVGPVSPRSIN